MIDESKENQKSKSDKALEKYLNAFNLRRDKDVLDLNLSGMQLDQVTSSLRRFKNLTRLWMHSNRIRDLSFIRHSYALSELYLQFNSIKSIAGCLRNLTNLKVLLLHGNEIFDLKLTAHELAYLRDLRNLSLFQNPVAFEKNYQRTVLQNCVSLEILDRNTVTLDDRKKCSKPISTANKMIEPNYNQLEIKSKTTRSLPSTQNDEELKRVEKSTDTSRQHENRIVTQKEAASSVREFSYFDWSKVSANAAKKETSSIDVKEANYHGIHDSSLNTNRAQQQQQQQQQHQQQYNSNKSDKSQLAQLPQIVTLRFF